jgi:hypothetical protein
MVFMVILYRLIPIFILAACTSPPEKPKPDDTASAQIAFEALDAEVGVTEVERDLTNVASSVTGEITDIESIIDPTISEMVEYHTGEPGWVEVEETRSFSNAIPPDKAKQELLQILRNKAVSKKVPANIEITSLLTDMMSESNGVANEQTAWSGFFKSTVSGVITAEEVLVDGFPKEIKNGYEKTMKLKAYVEPVSGQRDPGFYIDVKIENNLLQSGDELAFTVTPSKDCYIYIFNFMADQNAFLMYPNDYMKENFIQAKTTLEIPDPGIRKHVSFVVSTLPGESMSTESAYIVCTKEPVRVIESLPKIGQSMPVISRNSKSFMKLQRWLTKIPLDQRVEKNLIYHISKKENR